MSRAPAHSLTKAPTKGARHVVVDGKGHIMGRLASVVAKELLKGTHVTIVRCEDVSITGSFYRTKLNFLSFMNLRTATNPTHGPFHHRAPSKMVYRVIRGQVPHKTARGAAAMSRLQVYEGVPPPFDKVKRMVIPEALRVLRVQPRRPFTLLGRLAHEHGWKHQELVKQLEDKRKERSAAFYKGKKEATLKKAKATTAAAKDLGAHAAILAKYGY